MMVRTDQLLHIIEGTGSKIYARDLEAKTHGKAKTLVLSLKQYHTHYYQFYEKGMTRVMVGLQGLHKSDAFQWSNVSASVGLKLFCPWCFKLGGNTETVATHMREVHYWLTIACNICKAFASMLAQIILEHCSGCKVKWYKKVQGERTGKSFLNLVWVAPMNPAGQKNAHDLCPVQLMNMGWSSYLDFVFQAYFHSTIQALMFLF